MVNGERDGSERQRDYPETTCPSKDLKLAFEQTQGATVYVDLILIVPLEAEFEQFRRKFSLGENLTTDTMPTYQFECDGITGIVILQDEMGPWGATRAANSILGQYNCGIMICGGIAGKLSNDLEIGDVCYSGTVIDTTSNGKIEDGDGGGENVALAPNFFLTPKKLHGYLTFFRVMPEFGGAYKNWQDECALNALEVSASKKLKEFNLDPPKSLQGDIACGLVSQSSSYKKKLKSINRKILAIETESGAVARFCYENEIDFVALRGISDNADESKNKFEEETKDVARVVSAYNCFSFLHYQLSKNTFLRSYIQAKRPKQRGSEPSLFQDTIAAPNILAEVQDRLLEQTVENLRATNQVFRTLPDGAVLPLPRIRHRPSKGSQAATPSLPVEVKEAVGKFSRIFATIPRVFPDKSLAWLIAHALHYEQWEDKQFVPIVIAGDKVRPPRGELVRLAGVDLQKISISGGIPVLIIENFSVSSRTNSDFLAAQVREIGECRIVVLCHDDPNLKDIEAFIGKSGADHFDISETSFSEMANFLANHFSIALAEAQVVALRLKTVFERFRLQVHPTFFAGIPQELISSILNANRRGELIQLAVDGFLTHVVASDTEPGRLSRTTRAEFLRKYIRYAKIEKRTLTRDNLISITRSEFEKRGFPNDPERFVDHFFETNLLFEDDGKIEFSLTFVEAYYTALELCNDVNEACFYFDLDQQNFDYLSFDLYAEICADPQFVTMILEKLSSLEIIKQSTVANSKLLDGTIHPEILRKQNLNSVVGRRLEIATKAIEEGRDETKEKQRLLDVADRVFEETWELGSTPEKEGSDPVADVIGKALAQWSISVVLLGQGSEKIPGDLKEELASSVIKIGSVILNEWITFNASFNFQNLKDILTNGDFIQDIIDPSLELPTRLDPVELIKSFVDLAEMSLVSEPIRVILGHVSEEARHRVVVPAVNSVELENVLEKLMVVSWLSEIDPNGIKPKIDDLMKNFPRSPFLRSSVATYYMFRSYWSLSDKSVRLKMLNMANDLVKPLGREIPIAQLSKRLDEQDS